MANSSYQIRSDKTCYLGRFRTSLVKTKIAASVVASWERFTDADSELRRLRPAYSPDRQDIAVLETDELRKVTNWTNIIGYDPTTKKVVWVATSEGYFAGEKNFRGKQIEYDFESNTFSVVYGPLPEQNEGHAYDRNSSLPDKFGQFWCSALNSSSAPRLWKRDPKTGEYTLVTTVPAYTSSNTLHAVEVFPEWGTDGGVVLFGQRGTLAVWDIGTSQWSLLEEYPTDNRHYYGICVYVNGKIVFGGGETTSQLYTLDSSGTITTLTTVPPHPINCKSNYKYIPSPIDGENACYSLENDTKKMYKHDLDQDTWTEIGTAPNVAAGSLTQTAFVPLRGLNSIMCFHGNGRSGGQDQSEIWVYKIKSAIPSWVKNQPINTWGVVPTKNILANLNPKNRSDLNPNYPNKPEWEATGSFSNIVGAWCGASANRDLNELRINLPAGHADYAGAEPYSIYFESETPEFMMMHPPTGALPEAVLTNDGQEASGLYANGRPRAVHSYNKAIWIPGYGHAMVPQGSCSVAANNGTLRPILFDQISGEMSLFGADIGIGSSGDYSGGGTCWDSNRECVWVRRNGTGRFHRWYPATNTWETNVSDSIAVTGYIAMEYIPEHDCIVWVCTTFKTSGEVGVLDCSTGTIYRKPLSGTEVGMVFGNGMAIHRLSEKQFVTWNNSTDTATINTLNYDTHPVTGNWSVGQLGLSGSNTVIPSVGQATGTYGRFNHFPKLGIFTLINRVDEQPYFFKYTDITDNRPYWIKKQENNTWGIVPLTQTWEDADPKNDPLVNPNYPADAPWRAIVGAPSRFTAWNGHTSYNGVIYDPLAGGHDDYAGNESYKCDLNEENPKVIRLTNPSGAIGNQIVLDDGAENTGLYSDGKPRSAHNYNSPVFFPPMNKVVIGMHGTALYRSGVGGTKRPIVYNAENGAFELYGTELGTGHGNGWSMCSTYDSKRQEIWTRGGGTSRFSSYNPKTDTWTQRGNLYALSGDTTCCYVPDHDVIVIIATNKFVVLDCTTYTYTEKTLSGSLVGMSLNGNCQIHYIGNNTIATWNNDSNTEIINTFSFNGDPVAGNWSIGQLNISPSNNVTPTAKATMGTFGKFQWHPTLKIFTLINKIDESLYFFKVE